MSLRDTVIPMHINFTVDSDSLVIRQHFRPPFSVAFYRPIVPVESAPEYGSAVFIKIIFAHHKAVFTRLYINQLNSVVSFTANCYITSGHDIRNVILYACGQPIAAGRDDTFGAAVYLKSAVVFSYNSYYPRFKNL